METKKILTIQDISCVGQCSLTVALPIISACKVETCILPSAVLSTHTAGFKGFTFKDLTDEMPKIAEHWKSENISFSAVYTGYLGSEKQIEYVKDIASGLLEEGGKLIVDPAMADNGKLYPAFDKDFVNSMKSLCAMADIVLPNITEACFITDTEYKESYDYEYIDGLLKKLYAIGAKKIVLTGVGYKEGKTGVAVYDGESHLYYEHDKISKGCHGTGDVYASAFVGALVRGKSEFDSATIAADFTVECIKNTIDDPSHWYGVKFETCLDYLMNRLAE